MTKVIASSVLGIMTLGTLAAGCVMCFCLWKDPCVSLHKLLSVIAVTVMGVSIMLYRLLHGLRTRLVKYFHVGLHTGAIILFTAGIIMKSSTKYKTVPHGWPGNFLLVFLIAHYVVALIIFMYIYDSRRLRMTYVPFHDIIGLFLYICFMGCAIGAYYDFGSSEYTFMHLLYNIFGLVGGFMVVWAVLCPYFEWKANGPI